MQRIIDAYLTYVFHGCILYSHGIYFFYIGTHSVGVIRYDTRENGDLARITL